MPDKSTPNPSDPGSPGKGSYSNPGNDEAASGKDKPRLKLKRLVVKDLKINPHINPDAEPVPQAEPLSEPDPEPVLKDLSAERITRISRSQEDKPARPQKIRPADQTDSPKPKPVKKPDKQVSPAPEPVEEPQPEPKSGRKAPKTKAAPKGKGKKRLFPLLLILGSLGYGIHILFDPFGLKPEPIVPVEIPAQPAPEPRDSEPLPPPESIEITRDFTDGSAVNVSDYLDKLARQDLKLSNQPRGVYINKVFFAEGMPVNPSIGLTLDSIETGTGKSSFTVVNQEGETYTIPIP